MFVEPENGWTNMTESAELSASDGVAADFLGISVSIDENTIAAGASSAHNGQGAAYVFVKPKSGWRNRTETAEFELSTVQLGVSVAVGGKGKTIVAGAFGDSYPKGHKGAVYAFLRPPQGWKSTSKFNLELQGHPEKNFDDFGFSVAVNGSTAAVGAQYAPVIPPNGAGPGAVYLFGP